MDFGKLFVSLGICFFVAFLGSVFTTLSIANWYAVLNKPFFNPPNWIFGPVWTVFYFLMGLSLYLVWVKKGGGKKVGLGIRVFLVQLGFNLLWSIVFFGLHSPILGFVVIICLLTSIVYTMLVFRKISNLAFMLLVPYLLWVSFASILNLFIIILN